MPMFAGCFIVRSWRLASCFIGSQSLPGSYPSSISAWQLPRQFNIVLRFGWKDRALVGLCRVASLGREVGLLVLGWSPLVAKSAHTLWFASENWPETEVLSQLSQ